MMPTRSDWVMMVREKTPDPIGRRGGMSNRRRWRARPVAGRAVAFVAFLLPVVASLAAVLAMNALLPPPTTTSERILWWVLIVIAGIVPVPPSIYLAKRLMPLSMLLRVGLLFPDKAPSRFQV